MDGFITAAGIGLTALAALMLVHHYAKHGYVFDKNDINNHEFFIAIFGMLGIGMLIGQKVR